MGVKGTYLVGWQEAHHNIAVTSLRRSSYGIVSVRTSPNDRRVTDSAGHLVVRAIGGGASLSTNGGIPAPAHPPTHPSIHPLLLTAPLGMQG